jgi:glycosyltransferase involved in cell wall biosynthesis
MSRAPSKIRSWLEGAVAGVYDRLPPRAQNILWRRTPAERLREYRTRRNIAAVADDLRSRLTAHGGPSIVFLPTHTWFSTLFQRPQQLARAMASTGASVVYCEPWRTDHVASEAAIAERQFSGVRDFGERLHLLRWPNSGLRELLDRVTPDALLMLWPWQVVLFPEQSNSQVVYEVIDSHDLMPDVDEKWKERHRDWVHKADVLVASADDLLAELRADRSDTLLLPNAVMLEDWNKKTTAELPVDMAVPRRAERVIAYYGAMAEWFDWPLWVHAAKARPNWSFILIGLPYDGNYAAVHARASAAPNIYYLGPKRYDELPSYMTFVDVATIPFVLNSITHACSPVKLFEYMAAGKPVVTTAMREVLKYESVLVAKSPDDFVRRLDEAVAKHHDPAYLALLQAEAERNTWRSRAMTLSSALEAARSRYGGIPRRARLVEHA